MKHKRQRDDDDLEEVKQVLDESAEETGHIEEEEEEVSQLEPMDDDQIVAFCRNEISRGIGGTSYGDDASEDIALSFDYYFGRKPGVSKAYARDQNASRFVSLDIQDAVESTVAEIMPTFQTDELAFYPPEDDKDEVAAKLESDIVNYMLFHECNGYMLLKTCLKDTLLNRNGTAKAWWDRATKVSYETYENVTPMAMMELMQPRSESETIEIVEQESETTTVEMQDELGNSVQMESEIFTIKIKRLTVIEKPVVESVAPEQVIVSGDHDKPSLYDARFTAHENIVTQSYLIERGVSEEVARKLEDYNTNTEEQSRSRTAAEFDYYSEHDSVRHIRVFECYAFLDADGDGIAELRKILISGHNLLANDPVDTVALIGGVTTEVAHKYKGLSLFDKLKDIQDAKAPVMRSIINATQLSSNPRVGVLTGEVNMDDLLTSRTGGNVRMSRTDAIVPLPSAEVPMSSFSFLDLMNGIRRERGGAAIDTATTAQGMENSSEGTVGRVMSAMELLNAELAKTFGETLIRGIFVQLHQVIRENYKGEISAKLRGQWVTSTPSEWKERTGVVVSVGVSNAERARQKGAMREVIELQGVLQQNGSVMFDEAKAYQAIVKSVSLSGIQNPETYFIDPASEEGQAANQGKSQQQQELKAKQDALEQAMAKAQQDIATAEMIKGQASIMSQQVKAENEGLKNQISIMKTQLDDKNKSVDQQLKVREQDLKAEHSDSENAIKLTELELESQRDLSQQNEDNKTDAT